MKANEKQAGSMDQVEAIVIREADGRLTAIVGDEVVGCPTRAACVAAIRATGHELAEAYIWEVEGTMGADAWASICPDPDDLGEVLDDFDAYCDEAEAEDDPDGDDDPEACPPCGRRPGQGYDPDCPACRATLRILGPDA